MDRCSFLTKTGEKSKLFLELNKIYSDSYGLEFEEDVKFDPDNIEAYADTITPDIFEYAKIYSKAFKDEFGDWENITPETEIDFIGRLNEQGEPQLFSKRVIDGELYYYKKSTSKGNRGGAIILPMNSFNSLNPVEQNDLISTVFTKFIQDYVSKSDQTLSDAEIFNGVKNIILNQLKELAVIDEDLFYKLDGVYNTSLSALASVIRIQLESFNFKIVSSEFDEYTAATYDSTDEVDLEDTKVDLSNLKNSQNTPSKDTATPRTKLFLMSAVPEINENGEIEKSWLGLNKYLPFDIVWNALEPTLADIASIRFNQLGEPVFKSDIDLFIETIRNSESAKVYPGFEYLVRELEEFREKGDYNSNRKIGEFVAAFNKSANNYITTIFQNSDTPIKIIDTGKFVTPEVELINSWSSNFKANPKLVNENFDVNIQLLKDTFNKLDNSIFDKNISIDVKINNFEKVLNFLGITLSENLFEMYIKDGTESLEDEQKNLNAALTQLGYIVHNLEKNPNLKKEQGVWEQNKASIGKVTVEKVGDAFEVNNQLLQDLAHLTNLFTSNLQENMVISSEAYWKYSLTNTMQKRLNKVRQGDYSYFENLEQYTHLGKASLLVSEILSTKKLNEKNRLEALDKIKLKYDLDIKDANRGYVKSSEAGFYEQSFTDAITALAANPNVKSTQSGVATLNNETKTKAFKISGIPFVKTEYFQGQFSQEAINTVKNYLEADYNRIQDFIEMITPYLQYQSKSYNEVKDKLTGLVLYSDFVIEKDGTVNILKAGQLRSDLLGNETSDNIIVIKEKNNSISIALKDFEDILKTNGLTVEERINQILVDRYNETFSVLEKARFIVKDKKGDEYSLNKIVPKDIQKVYNKAPLQAVADIMLNQFIGGVEFMAVFTGDSTHYKNLMDYSKRVPKVHTDGIYNIVLSPSQEKFKVSVTADNVIKELYTKEELENIAKAKGMSYDDLIRENPSLIPSSVDLTDAQGIMSIKRWKYLNTANWTSVHESAYNKMKNGEELTPEELYVSIQPMKMVHDSTMLYNGRMIPVYLKYSLFVVSPKLAKGNPAIQRLLDEMERTGTDEVIAVSGVKVGPMNITNVNNNGKMLTDFELVPFELENEFSKLQQQLPTKKFKPTELASQIQKNILSQLDLIGNVYDLDGQPVNGKRINEVIKNLFDKIISLQYDKFVSKFYNEETGILNKEKFYEVIISQLNPADKHLIMALVQDMSFDVFFNSSSLMENIIYSQIKSAALRPKTNGGSLIQVANFGIQDINDFDNSGIKMLIPQEGYTNLRPPTYNENGEFESGQVFLPHHFIAKYIPNYQEFTGEQIKQLLPKEAFELIGYRIPNQGMSSNALLEVVGILPPEYGDSIVVYTGVTYITGSDFDIDKMYVMMPTIDVEFNPQYRQALNIFVDTQLSEYKQIKSKYGKIQAIRDILIQNNVEVLPLINEVLNRFDNTEITNEEYFEIKNYFIKQSTRVDGLIDYNTFHKANPTLLKTPHKFSYAYDLGETELDVDIEHLQNGLFETYKAILKSKHTFLNSVRSIDAGDLKDFINDELELEAIPLKPLEFFTGDYQRRQKKLLKVGKAGVGQTANHVVDVPLVVLSNLKFNHNNILGKENVNLDLEGLVNLAIDKAKVTLIPYEWSLSMFLNAFVDIGKDDFITRANYNTMTNGPAFMMIRSGFDYKWVTTFMSSEVIKELVEVTDELESIFNTDKNKPKPHNLLLSKYGIDDKETAYKVSVLADKIINYDLDTLIKLVKQDRTNPDDIFRAALLTKFLEIRNLAKYFNNGVLATKIETSPAKSAISRIVAENKIQNVINEGLYENFMNKITNTHLNAYYEYGLNEPKEWLRKLLWKEDFGKILFDTYSELQRGTVLLDEQLGNDISRMFNNYVLSQLPNTIFSEKAYQNFIKNITAEKGNTLFDKLKQADKKLNEQFPEEAYNISMLVNSLSSSVVKLKEKGVTTNYTFIQTNTGTDANAALSNAKIEAWEYMHNFYFNVYLNNAKNRTNEENEKYRLMGKELNKLALELFQYSYFTSQSFKTGVQNINKFIPPSFFIDFKTIVTLKNDEGVLEDTVIPFSIEESFRETGRSLIGNPKTYQKIAELGINSYRLVPNTKGVINNNTGYYELDFKQNPNIIIDYPDGRIRAAKFVKSNLDSTGFNFYVLEKITNSDTGIPIKALYRPIKTKAFTKLDKHEIYNPFVETQIVQTIEDNTREIDNISELPTPNMKELLLNDNVDTQDKTNQSNQDINPANFTNHSGGAYGGDTFWDIIGREFGVFNHKHYKDAGNANLSQQLRNTQKVYSKLGNKTQSKNVVIKPWGELKDAKIAITPQGIISTRIRNTNEHFGNPFSHDPAGKTQGLIKTETIKEAVEKYIDWVINSQDKRAIWIRSKLNSGELRNQPILYYKELGEPSHATALDYLINNWEKISKTEILTEEQMNFARQKVKELLGIEYKDDLRGNLQVRNFYQIYNADAVYAVAKLNSNKDGVSGGTNTAVQLGIKLNKPVYVWDINTEQWYEFSEKIEKDGSIVYSNFFPSETPILTKNFAGVGSRDIENYNVQKDGKWQPREEYVGKEKEEKAKQAIRDVYEKTFNQSNQDINNQTEEVNFAELDKTRKEFYMQKLNLMFDTSSEKYKEILDFIENNDLSKFENNSWLFKNLC